MTSRYLCRHTDVRNSSYKEYEAWNTPVGAHVFADKYHPRFAGRLDPVG